jgi:hypothetical protein
MASGSWQKSSRGYVVQFFQATGKEWKHETITEEKDLREQMERWD